MISNDEKNCEMRKDSCRKVHFNRKMANAKPLIILKQQENIIEKGLMSVIENMKIDSVVLQNILHEYNDVITKREKILDTIYKDLCVVNSELQSVKNVTNDVQEMQKLDVNAYKLRLIRLSQKIHDLKNSCSVRTLVEEQRELEYDVNEFEFNLEKYDSTYNKIPRSLCCNKEAKREEGSYKEAKNFHALVARTGHTNGWSEEDHLLFLKMRKKCNNVPALVSAMQIKCPDLTVEAIVNHESWYISYLTLRGKQRYAVKEWRKRKELDKTGKNNLEDENIENDFDRNDLSYKNPKKEATAISNRVELSQIKAVKSYNTNDSKREEKKELIKKWKIDKERKRSMDAEQLKKQLELKKQIAEHQKRKKSEKVQEALSEYRRKKSIEASLSENSKIKCTYNSALIQEFRKQDELFMEKRKEQISRSRKSNENVATELRKRPHTTKTQNNSTLLNNTKVWSEKCKTAISTMKRFNSLQYIKDVPDLTTRWRNEESADLRNKSLFN